MLDTSEDAQKKITDSPRRQEKTQAEDVRTEEKPSDEQCSPAKGRGFGVYVREGCRVEARQVGAYLIIQKPMC